MYGELRYALELRVCTQLKMCSTNRLVKSESEGSAACFWGFLYS